MPSNRRNPFPGTPGRPPKGLGTPRLPARPDAG